MMPSLLCAPVLRRLQLARFFFSVSAAILVALNPTTSFAFDARRGHCRHFQPDGPSALTSIHTRPIGPCPRLSTLLSLSLSTSDAPSTTTSGSSAVRSTKTPLPTDSKQLQLISFYHFVPIAQPENIRDTLFEHLQTIEGLRGTVYIATEGINAQFAVPVGGPLEELLHVFGKEEIGEDSDRGGECLPFNVFEKNPPNMGNVVDIDTPTFDRLIVRTRDCILRDRMNLEGGVSLDWSDTGTELNPSEWDEQLRQPDSSNIQLLDCRNAYESDEGSFLSAKPLNTQTFSDTWSILDSQVKSQYLDPSKPVHIFCTGGIRCVKVGAYLKQQLGFDDVRSLKHGIIGYEKWVGEDTENDSKADSSSNDDSDDKERKSLWVGENFLFDKRRFAKEGDDITDKKLRS